MATVQLAARLQRSALAAAAASEAAHAVATGTDRSTADAQIRRLVGRGAEIHWSTDRDAVRVEVVIDSPTVPGLSTRVRRGATARMEQLA